MPIRILSVFGTRPEAIKMAPVVLALQAHPAVESVVCVTAQHREMLDRVLDLFCIVPDHDLDLMEHGQTLTQITCRAMNGLSAILEREHFDAVLVHGDTTTTLAAALTAFYHRIPVGHVEAGLRTHDLDYPFPEEADRTLVARLARWHFAPSATCEDNLIAEGIPADRIVRLPHNTVIDTVRLVAQMPHPAHSAVIADALASGRRIVLVTAHRRESWGTPMEGIFSAIARIAARHTDVHLLVAIHPNPVVTDAAHRIMGDAQRIDLIGPQDYLPFTHLMAAAQLIVSDSGGIQEEGPALGTPVVVLRDATEQTELLERGAIVVAGTAESTVFATIDSILRDPARLERMNAACPQPGPDNATKAIVDTLLTTLSPTSGGCG